MAPYNYYDPELCAKIGRCADTSGNIVLVSMQLGQPISESTVRGFNKTYCSALVKPDMLTQLQGWNTDCAVATKYNNPELFHTHGSSVVLGKKYTNSVLGGNGSGEVKSYPSSAVSSKSIFNCEEE